MLKRSDIEQKLLYRKGFEHIGSGCYSAVFATKHPNKVIKVGRLDDAWPHYIHWALGQGYLGTYAPLVYSITPHDDCYIAVVERLVKFTPETRPEGFYQLVEEIQYNRPPPSYKAFCNAFHSWRNRNGLGNDIGASNILVRDGTEIVLNDPVCGSFYGPYVPITALPHASHLPTRERPAPLHVLLHEIATS